jgi:hypothetical protein
VTREPKSKKGAKAMAVTIRNEIRKNDQGEGEVWANLGDILDWLDTLPAEATHPAAAGAAMEIKRMLLEQFSSATREQFG